MATQRMTSSKLWAMRATLTLSTIFAFHPATIMIRPAQTADAAGSGTACDMQNMAKGLRRAMRACINSRASEIDEGSTHRD